MKKRRIVLASILKPVDDTRMFEKIGGSLSRVNDYEIFVIGYPSQGIPISQHTITQLSLKSFRRISLDRLLAPWQTLRILHKVKPELLIVNTHELLIVSVLNRIFYGTKIIYDIRENYWRNILHTKAFPAPFRALLATWVRLKEKLSSPLFHAFFLAEKTYVSELTFLRGRQIVLENKTLLPKGFIRVPEPEKIRLLFSGTLAESTGVFQAIEVSKKLHQANAQVELHIIGYCALASTLSMIKKTIANLPYISISGGDQLVPHHEIFRAIAYSDFGIISYPPAYHIENRVPTKLYEYLACRLPILLQEYKPWVEICDKYKAAIPIDFMNPNGSELLKNMSTQIFYDTQPSDVTWASEEPKLLKKVSDILI